MSSNLLLTSSCFCAWSESLDGGQGWRKEEEMGGEGDGMGGEVRGREYREEPIRYQTSQSYANCGHSAGTTTESQHTVGHLHALSVDKRQSDTTLCPNL